MPGGAPCPADSFSVPFVQLGIGDMDGFQGDTEEEEEDSDCIIVDILGTGREGPGEHLGRALGGTPVTPALWEAEVGGVQV